MQANTLLWLRFFAASFALAIQGDAMKPTSKALNASFGLISAFQISPALEKLGIRNIIRHPGKRHPSEQFVPFGCD